VIFTSENGSIEDQSVEKTKKGEETNGKNKFLYPSILLCRNTSFF